MAFNATSFAYNGVSCTTYGLMLADVDTEQQDRGSVGTVTINDDTQNNSWRHFHYGITQNDVHEFTLPMCKHDGSLFARTEVMSISKWLLGHSEYKELAFDDTELSGFFYNAICTNLDLIQVNADIIGLSAKFTCDSQFAYMSEQTMTYFLNGTKSLTFINQSNINHAFKPTITLSDIVGATFSMTVNGVEFTMQNLVVGDTVTIDCERKTITSLGGYETIYFSGCNFKFPKFQQGVVPFTASGNCTLQIKGCFPVAVGY